jgi:hypothetical protein
MSQYFDLDGELFYKDEASAQKARDTLVKGGWLERIEGTDQYGWTCDGCGFIDEENATTPMAGASLYFNGGTQRNLGRIIDTLLEGADFPYSHLRMCTTDGDYAMWELQGDKLVCLSDDAVLKIAGASSFDEIFDSFGTDRHEQFDDAMYEWLIAS